MRDAALGRSPALSGVQHSAGATANSRQPQMKPFGVAIDVDGKPELYENDLAEDATIDTRRFDSALFRDAAVDPDTTKLNAGIIQ